MPSDINLIDSSIAAVIARLYTHPIDTIRVRYQTTPRGTKFKHLIPTLSIPKLYRGFPVAATFSIPAVSTYLYVYDSTKHLLSDKLGLSKDRVWNHALSGVAAEVISGVFWTPMEVLKSKLQYSTAYTPTQILEVVNNEFVKKNMPLPELAPPPPVDLNVTRSTLTLSREILETEGIKGFYRGYWLTLAVFVPQTVIYFVIYEKLKARGAKSDAEKIKRIEEFSNIQHYDRYGLPRKPAPKVHPHVALAFSSYFIYSAIASAIAASISNVVDVVKTRWQVTYKNEENIKSPLQIIKNLYMHEGGIFAFGRGMIARVAWAVPATSLSMAVFEVLKELRRKRALELEENSIS